jgi:hypothetical protein
VFQFVMSRCAIAMRRPANGGRVRTCREFIAPCARSGLRRTERAAAREVKN